MANNLFDIYAKQYADNFELVLQEMMPRGQVACTVSYDGRGESMQIVDKIGTVVMQEVTDPGADIIWQNPTTEARWVAPSFFDAAIPIRDQDKLKLLGDPTSDYVQDVVEAHNRQVTTTIRDAALGTAATGKSGTTTKAFDAANNTIAVNYGAGGNTGLTVAKLLKAEQRVLAAHVDPTVEKCYCLVSSKQIMNLKREPQFINADYNPDPILARGGVMARWGIWNFIHTELLGVDSSGYRRVICMSQKAVELKYWQDKIIRVSERVDKRGYPFQAYIKAGFGAVRKWEERVVELLCTESGL